MKGRLESRPGFSKLFKIKNTMTIGDKVKMPDVVKESMSKESGIGIEQLALLRGKTLTVCEIITDADGGFDWVNVEESIFSIPVKWLTTQPADQ